MPDRHQKLFELFVRENEGSTIAYIRTMVRDQGLAEDLFQETMLTAWKRFDDFDSSKPFAPWLRGIALNLIRNAWRKTAADRLVFDESTATLAERAIAAVENSEGDSWQERLVALKQCVALLPEASQALVQANYRDGEQADLIAARLGIAHATVRKRLQRIRDQLFLCLQHRLGEVFT
jgi:RNA polymerase sigma-70 factor